MVPLMCCGCESERCPPIPLSQCAQGKVEAPILSMVIQFYEALRCQNSTVFILFTAALWFPTYLVYVQDSSLGEYAYTLRIFRRSLVPLSIRSLERGKRLCSSQQNRSSKVWDISYWLTVCYLVAGIQGSGTLGKDGGMCRDPLSSSKDHQDGNQHECLIKNKSTGTG